MSLPFDPTIPIYKAFAPTVESGESFSRPNYTPMNAHTNHSTNSVSSETPPISSTTNATILPGTVPIAPGVVYDSALQSELRILRDIKIPVPVGYGPHKVAPHHERIIDLLLTRPKMSLNELAREVGLAPTTVSTIKSSDAFKLEYARRRAEFNLELGRNLQSKLLSLSDQAISKMVEVLETTDVDPRTVLDVIDKTARLGLPAELQPTKTGATQQANVSLAFTVVNRDAYQRARERVRTLHSGIDPDTKEDTVMDPKP